MSIIDTTIPVSLDAELTALLDSLDELSGDDFDFEDDVILEPFDEDDYDDYSDFDDYDDWDYGDDWDIDPDDDEV